MSYTWQPISERSGVYSPSSLPATGGRERFGGEFKAARSGECFIPQRDALGATREETDSIYPVTRRHVCGMINPVWAGS
jgi:hypothetical protein